MRHAVGYLGKLSVVESVDVTSKIAGHAPYTFKANAFSCCFLHNEIFLSLICCKYNCTVTRILAVAKTQARIRKVEAVERDTLRDEGSYVSRGMAATARLRCEAKDFRLSPSDSWLKSFRLNMAAEGNIVLIILPSAEPRKTITVCSNGGT